MKASPLVSVIIPVYNVKEYLQECVNSVIDQTYINIEIILVDDGSNDGSERIIDEIYRNRPGIHVVRQNNRGLSAARNAGKAVCRGEYILFLDSDDYLEKTTVEKLAYIAIAEQADVVFFDGKTFSDGNEPSAKSFNYLRKRNYGSGQGREMLKNLLEHDEYSASVPMHFYKADYLDKNNIQFCEGIIHEDVLFSYLIYMANGHVSHCHEALYNRRVRSGSTMTADNIRDKYIGLQRVFHEIALLYESAVYKDDTAKMYLIRISQALIYKYASLSDNDKEEYEQIHNDCKKRILKSHGYGSFQLSKICSGGIRNLYYRILLRAESFMNIQRNRKGLQ